MNEKSLDILKRYDINVYHIMKGRGGMILDTDVGTKLFLECTYPRQYYEKENQFAKAVADNGFLQVDTLFENIDGQVITVDEEENKCFVVKNWFDGRECNVKDISDLCLAVKSLARLHTAMDLAAVSIAEKKEITVIQSQIKDMYKRHTKELKMAWNYLKGKKKKNDFEQLALTSMDEFYNQAKDAMEKINDSRFDGMFKQIEEQCTLCHGNFNYHNCFVYGGAMAITNFNKCRNDCQMWDLYQFMRKVLEKYRWNMELAYKLISEYDKVKTISDIELEFLYVLFEYPEKYWKIINYYLNTNKAWIPPKSYDKLNTVVQQQSERCEFLATTGVL